MSEPLTRKTQITYEDYAAALDEIERLREALAEIRDLARTGLPPAGWEESYWLMHKSNRIAGMADAALTSGIQWMPLAQPPQEANEG